MELSPTGIPVFWIAVAAIVAALAIGFQWGGAPVERQQEIAAAVQPGYEIDNWREQLRGRTLKQGESGRIYP